MCEPWCWSPDVVARLTDHDIDVIRKSQLARNQLAKLMAGDGDASPPLPPDPTRKGALWEYLVSTGMSEAEADEVTRGQR